MPVDAVEDAGRVLELAARVVVQHRAMLDEHVAVIELAVAALIYDEEDGAAALARVAIPDDCAGDEHAVALPAVGVNRAAAAAAGSAGLLRIGPEADRPVVDEHAVVDGEAGKQ